MKVVAVITALLAGCAFAQLNADLTIDVPGRYLLDASISEILSGDGAISDLCALRVRIRDETTSTPEISSLDDTPYQLYPPSSVVVGTDCQAVGDTALVVFVNGANASSLPPELISGLGPILTDPALADLITELINLPENAIFVFMRTAVCGGRVSVGEGSPAGIMFRAVADQELLGQSLTEGTRYFHYVVTDSQGNPEVLCSYAEPTGPSGSPTPTPSPDAGGSPAPSTTPISTPPGGATATPIPSPDASGSPTPDASGTATPSTTPDASGTATPIPSPDASGSATPIPSPDASGTATPSITFGPNTTFTPGPTPPGGVTATPSGTGSGSLSPDASSSPTPDASGTATPSTSGGPSSSPAPSTTPTPTAAPCFPGSSTVELESGEHVAMDALEVGHRVRVSGDEFSDVFFFGHKVAEEVADYVKVTTEAGNALWIAPNHYMYANSRMVAAGAIKVGDSVELGSGDVAEVVSVEVEKRAGLYAPHTMHGDIVVDGVRASTYTQVVHPTAAKMLLWPLKVLYRLRLPAVKVLEKASRGKLARTIGLPKGPLVL